MREADFGCARYDACYDPPPVDWAPWGWPEFILVLVIVLLIIGLIWSIVQTPAKPEPSLREALEKEIDGAKKDATNWGESKSAALVDRLADKIRAELSKRGF